MKGTGFEGSHIRVHMYFQIEELLNSGFTAGSKAPSDIAKIAGEMDFSSLFVNRNKCNIKFIGKYLNQLIFINDWHRIYHRIPDDSIILLQHTFRCPQMGRRKALNYLKEKKHCSIITVIHDVEELREAYFSDFQKKEMRFTMEISDVIIVHNETMRKWFIDKGVSESKLISLKIFDYLSDVEITDKIFAPNLVIAGNLDSSKAAYLSEIQTVENIHFDLFGSNWAGELFDNITYHGAFKPEELPKQFFQGFGLVWDGNTIVTCSGKTGNYLRYNNPHKLSLYLAAGLPVVIWSQAAEADFVKDLNLGICVDSLKEAGEKIKCVTHDQYRQMANNVKNQSEKLRHGYYTKDAITKAISIIENSRKKTN